MSAHSASRAELGPQRLSHATAHDQIENADSDSSGMLFWLLHVCSQPATASSWFWAYPMGYSALFPFEPAECQRLFRGIYGETAATSRGGLDVDKLTAQPTRARAGVNEHQISP